MRPPAVCGTIAGAHRHRALKERVCLDCCFANTDYKRARLIATGKQRGITLTPSLLALLLRFLWAQPDVMQRARAELGPLTVDTVMALSEPIPGGEAA